MSDLAHYLSLRPNPQPPIFEQALIDCIDIFSMAGIAESTRFKLIKDVLISTKAEDDRFERENDMRVKAFRMPKHEPAKYRSNLSQIFYACHRIATLSGNPAPKSIEIRKIIEESRLFDYTPTEDYWAASRRGKKPRGPSHKSPSTLSVEDIDTGLIEAINLEEIIPAPEEEPIEPKVTIVHEAIRPDNGPGLSIPLPPSRRASVPTEGTDPAPEPYTPD